jgi:hypothetical protein
MELKPSNCREVLAFFDLPKKIFDMLDNESNLRSVFNMKKEWLT